MIVADTNLVAYLLIEGDQTEAARRALARDPDWTMPTLWRSEFLSVLAVSHRAGVLDLDQALHVWRVATDLFGAREVEVDGESALRTAVEASISAYDAQFVVLAEQLGVSLVTADRKLTEACAPPAVALGEFAAG